MLSKCLILIVESDPYVALDLSAMVEEMDGQVIGPTYDVAEALDLLRADSASAAIVDWQLPGCDASPIASWLSERHVPFVIQSTGRLSAGDRERHPDPPLLIRPLQPRTVIARLIVEMRRIARLPNDLPEQAKA